MLNLPSGTRKQTVGGRRIEIIAENEDSDFVTEADEEGDMVADLNNLPESFSQVTGAHISIINDSRRVSSMVRINQTKSQLDKP